MKHVLLLAACLPLFSLCLRAQKKSAYSERAAEVEKEIRDGAPKQFGVASLSDSMKDQTVIIATSFDVFSKVKGSMGIEKPMYFQTTFHERVKIGDKPALDKYSTLEYEKQIDRSFHGFFMSNRNTLNRYVGATIVKPSGKIITVNTDEEVLTKNESRYKASKLAISDLQIGDILDYYIRVEQNKQASSEAQGPYVFFLGGEYPVLYQYLHLVLDEKSTVNYIAANGAPLFKEESDGDDNIVLSLGVSNIPKRESSYWSSPYRQYPYITIKYEWQSKMTARYTKTDRGSVNHTNISDDVVSDFKREMSNYTSSQSNGDIKNTFGLRNTIATYFGSIKEMEKAPVDSFLHVFQNAWRQYAFAQFVKKNIENVEQLTYYSANSKISCLVASSILNTMHIDHDLCLVPSRFGPSMKNVMEGSDFEAILRLRTDKGISWMGFDDIGLQYNEIPARMQGEQAIAIEMGSNGGKHEQSDVKLPESKPSDNSIVETISISLKPSDMSTLMIDRSSVETGAMRHGDQRNLLLAQDVDTTLSGSVDKQNLVEELGDKRKTSKLSQEFDAAFTQVKAGQKKSFEEEIKTQYDQAPKELTSYSVEKDGLLTDPFAFKETFTMDNFVKKAGNNYILEAGKLVGTITTVEEKDRDRKIDIYIFCPRSFTYNITVTVPDGYRVKGLENFSTSISNETGSLSATAKEDGNHVIISVNRIYNHSKEPLSNWTKMLTLVDAFYNIYNQKLLLEKKS